MKNTTLLTLASTALLAGPLSAQDPQVPSNEELARRIDVLGEAIDFSGNNSKFSFGGYGEATYRNWASKTDGGAPSGKSDEFDLHRVVFYFGYQFDDVWSFNSEIEYEHTDQLAVEFAQIDGHFSDALNFRGGHVLIPMGIVNQMHEPTTFFSARRPLVERYILPSTWHENGVGTFGASGDLSWEAYIVNGFDAAGFDPSSSGLRGGRQGGDKAGAEDLALTGRLDWRGVDGLLLGGSFYQGDSSQGVGANDFGVTVTELHAQYDHGPMRFRALWADATIDDADLLATPSASDDLSGWYLEGGYDVFANSDNGQSLTPFLRYEQYDLLESTSADTAVTAMVVGVAYQPQENVTFKLDYMDLGNDADTQVDVIEFTIGWAF
ncbi:MAG: hypothetical protein GY747_03925 [Planctomycetes bacterium]|nr:hypothetical protein [Planctomycetota bacterium]MCP4770952.1 hypothetical protein [Planctomycetota bacterium]MCP4861672.1 hypothetical protein [Planctomycetota bacterium]